jgi:hypothetical protein
MSKLKDQTQMGVQILPFELLGKGHCGIFFAMEVNG